MDVKINLVTHIFDETSTNKNEDLINITDLKLLNNMTRHENVSQIHDQLTPEENFEFMNAIDDAANTKTNNKNISNNLNSTISNNLNSTISNNLKLEGDDSEERVVDEDYSLLIHDAIVLFSCRHCRLAYDTYVLLKDHCVVEHGVVLQRKDCQHCLEVLPTHIGLLHHLKQSHINILPPEQADKLKKKFPLEKPSKRFLCHQCNKAFCSKASLLNHLNKFHITNHFSETPPKRSRKEDFHCVECEISFESCKELSQHHNTTHNTKVLLCMDCDSSFLTRSSLNLHNIYHHRVHRCSSCLILFQGRLALTNHVKSLHPGMPVYRADSRFVCEYCSECFSVRAQLSDHIQSTHLGRINQCEDCGKVLATSETLKVHRLKHRPDKHRTCEHCGKQFYRTGMLTEHIRASHSEVLSDEWRQRTTCPYCQARFTRRESMRRHIEAKHEPKQFVCSFCERPFTCRRYLVRHENKHHLGRPSS